MDHCFGQFLDALESTGLDKNTAVIFTADHGTNVGERGRFGKGQPVVSRKRTSRSLSDFQKAIRAEATSLCNLKISSRRFSISWGEARPDGIEGHDIVTPARNGESGERELALSGGSIERWQNAAENPNINLFTIFTREWSLEVGTTPENSKLVRLGELETFPVNIRISLPKLHAAAVDEIERRGTDPALMAWLRSGGEVAFPTDATYWNGYPGPAGYRPYFGKLYTGE